MAEADGAGASAAVEAASVAVAADSGAAARPEAGNYMTNADRFFTAEEKQRIEQAVVAAEQKTAGEIVPMLVASSGRYAEVELTAVVIGLVVGTLTAFIWHDPWGWLQIYLLWPALGALVGFVVASVPAVKRRMLSQARISEAVHVRSLAAFTGQGLHHTKAHTGILILASLLEHRVIILADRGINEKVETGTWNQVVELITRGLQSGNACEAFCKAIERCGEILAQHFPRSPDDRDELSNKLVTER